MVSKWALKYDCLFQDPADVDLGRFNDDSSQIDLGSQINLSFCLGVRKYKLEKNI